MKNHDHDQITQYLMDSCQSCRQNARNKAAALYEDHRLHSLPLVEKYAELTSLLDRKTKQAATLNRQEYLSKGNSPNFLLKYFTSGNRFFSFDEEELYLQALTLTEEIKTIKHLLEETGIQLEIEKVDAWIAEAISSGKKPEDKLINSRNYLQLQLRILQSHDPDKEDSQPKGSRGPAKKCCFGMQCSVELFRQIMEELNSEIHYLKPGTSVDDYIAVVTAPVPALTGIPLHMGCNNKQFMYVMYYFQSLFQSFDAATVANSGLFFSKEGHVYNSHNLNCTNLTHIEKRYAIDAIFRKYGVTLPEKYKYLLKGI